MISSLRTRNLFFILLISAAFLSLLIYSPVAFGSITTCAELQSGLYALERSGGGTLTLPAGGDIPCPRQELVAGYKGSGRFDVGLLIPEGVTLDLNGRKIRLDLAGGLTYGLRLARNAGVINGVVEVISGGNVDASAMWNSAITVGTGFGDGGTADNPSYFSSIGNFRIENMTVIQRFARPSIVLMADAHDGIVRNVTIADSSATTTGIMLHWGEVGPLSAADSTMTDMRSLFQQGLVYTTHPHDIFLENIHIGRLTNSQSVGIYTGAVYRITFNNIDIAEAETGFDLRGGDLGFEFAREPDRSAAHMGIVARNFTLNNIHRFGIIAEGSADNVYRARLNNGYDSFLNPVSPGLNAPIFESGVIRGIGARTDRGVFLQAATDAHISYLQVFDFLRGINLHSWANNALVEHNTISNADSPLPTSGDFPPQGSVIRFNTIIPPPSSCISQPSHYYCSGSDLYWQNDANCAMIHVQTCEYGCSAGACIIPAPTCSLSVSRATTAAGENVRLTWSSAHADSMTGLPGAASYSPNGTLIVSPVTPITYTATFQGPGGSATCSATITPTSPSSCISQPSHYYCSGSDLYWQNDADCAMMLQQQSSQHCSSGLYVP